MGLLGLSFSHHTIDISVNVEIEKEHDERAGVEQQGVMHPVRKIAIRVKRIHAGDEA